MKNIFKFGFIFLTYMSLFLQINVLLGAANPNKPTRLAYDQEYLNGIVSIHADAYMQECNVQRETEKLINKFKSRISEIDNEYEDILIQLNVFGFQDIQKPDTATERTLNARISELCEEKTKIYKFINESLMSILEERQQQEVRDYINKRKNFFVLNQKIIHLGGIPAYELDKSIFVPFDQIQDDRPDACIYFNELRLMRVAPSCFIEFAASTGCQQAQNLIASTANIEPMEEGSATAAPEETDAAGMPMEEDTQPAPAKTEHERLYPDVINTVQETLATPMEFIPEPMIHPPVSIQPAPVCTELQPNCNDQISAITEDFSHLSIQSKPKKPSAADYHHNGQYQEALKLIKQTNNQALITWYQGFCSLNNYAQGEAQIKKGLKLLESLVSLIPDKQLPGVQNFLGFKDVVELLKHLQNDVRAQAFLIRLGLTKTIKLNLKGLVRRFVQEAQLSQNASVQVVLGYLFYYGQGVKQDLDQTVNFLIQALKNPTLNPHEKEEIIYILGQMGQALFDVNFQATPHDQRAYPSQNDNQTAAAIQACYALVPALISSDPLKAAYMFIAAENTVAFLCENQSAHELASLPSGINALNVLHKCVLEKENPDALAALMFCFARRYMSLICHNGLIGDLTAISKLFLREATQYLAQSHHKNERRNLLMGLACNMYCIMGNKIDVDRSILINLMQGIVNICPEQYWFFRYNLESLKAGSQDGQLEPLSQFNTLLPQVANDRLISAMIISDIKNKSGWGCSIV